MRTGQAYRASARRAFDLPPRWAERRGRVVLRQAQDERQWCDATNERIDALDRILANFDREPYPGFEDDLVKAYPDGPVAVINWDFGSAVSGVESESAERAEPAGDSGREAQAAEVSSGATPDGGVLDPANAGECPQDPEIESFPAQPLPRRKVGPARGNVQTPRIAPAPVRVALPSTSAMDDRAVRVQQAGLTIGARRSVAKPDTTWCAVCAWHKPLWMGRDCIEAGCPLKPLARAQGGKA
ncbi:hypothetical protein [Novosphingobium sp. FKTRR1]|uniref:hypothetical protein n=1 Tax=Novosphingobium sp. FKTRR1 TaxID=2879118 RepID=UPI001CF0621B|nr:hypothetical protein [Novosphingobium sp. FKTRR1]